MTLDMFGASPFPVGFDYKMDAVSADEERALLADIKALPFQEFDFHGFLGKRRVVSFGWKYDFAAAALREAEPIPAFLQAVRDQAAATINRDAASFEQVLVTEYGPGAGIGWHKDKAVFDEVVGLSLATACTLRLRRRVGEKWQRISTELAPRSIYLLSGAVRSEWEHSIPPVSETRYSLTFRSMVRER